MSDAIGKRVTISKVAFACMLCGTFVAAVSQSMLTTALPPIMHEYGIGAVEGQLLTTAYMYTLGIVAAFSAFLIMRFDKRILFTVSLSLFIIGCTLSYFTDSYALLLSSRLMQAFGAGILMPLIQVISLQMSSKENYGKSLGIVGLVFGFSPVLGPSLSGIIADAWGWRAIFVILGSIAIAMLIASTILLRKVDAFAEGKRHVTLDLPSLLLYTIGLVCIMIGVTGLENFGFFDFRAYIPAVIGIALIVFFCCRQVKLDQPYLKITLFKNKTFAYGVILLAIAQVVLFSSGLQMPMYIQDIMDLSATMSGLLLLPGALCNPILNPLTGRLYDRVGAKPVAAIGFACMLIGVGGFVFLTHDAPLWLLVALYMVRMMGVAFLIMPMTAYAMSDLEKDDLPYGTAIVNSLRQVIGSLCASAIVTFSALMSTGKADSDVISLFGFHASFAILALLVLIGFSIAMVAIKRKGGNGGGSHVPTSEKATVDDVLPSKGR